MTDPNLAAAREEVALCRECVEDAEANVEAAEFELNKARKWLCDAEAEVQRLEQQDDTD